MAAPQCFISNYSQTLLVSTWVSKYSWIVSILIALSLLHTIPCIESTLESKYTPDSKYVFFLPLRVLTIQALLYLFFINNKSRIAQWYYRRTVGHDFSDTCKCSHATTNLVPPKSCPAWVLINYKLYTVEALGLGLG